MNTTINYPVDNLDNSVILFYENEKYAITKIQNAIRIYNACRQLKNLRSQSITIVDAKDSGKPYLDIWRSVWDLEKELKEDKGIVEPTDYITKEYFNGSHIEPGLASPDTILLAKKDNDIVGFIITAKKEKTLLGPLPEDTCYVAYLAVDAIVKDSGIGTKLMLNAMQKAKEQGKNYLILTYLDKGQGLTEARCLAKKQFYHSFTKKFQIPMEIKLKVYCSRQRNVVVSYDLRNIDFKR